MSKIRGTEFKAVMEAAQIRCRDEQSSFYHPIPSIAGLARLRPFDGPIFYVTKFNGEEITYLVHGDKACYGFSTKASKTRALSTAEPRLFHEIQHMIQSTRKKLAQSVNSG